MVDEEVRQFLLQLPHMHSTELVAHMMVASAAKAMTFEEPGEIR
jgi:hypothetical protein